MTSSRPSPCLLYTQSKPDKVSDNMIGYLESAGWSFSTAPSVGRQPRLGLAIISQNIPSSPVINHLLAFGDQVSWLTLLPEDFLSDSNNLDLLHFCYSFQAINTEPAWVHHEMQRIAKITELEDKTIPTPYSPYHSKNPVMQKVYGQAQKVAKSDASILLQGPSGSGKQHLSTFIHTHSQRQNGPFVSFNCAGMSPTLAKDELFGHEKGSFTGASRTHLGIFEQANGGTLLLDEIGDLPLELQGNFLHVLESSTIRRIGGQSPQPIDIRVICATNVDIEQKIAEKQFREDLYYRLNVITLHIPPLSERQEDIVPLAETFIRQYSHDRHATPRLSAEATDDIIRYSWPGNIRELSNVMQRAVLLNESGIIQPGDLMLSPDSSSKGKTQNSKEFRYCIEQTKLKSITAALSNNKGNITRAAKELGISRYTFYRQMKLLNINP